MIKPRKRKKKTGARVLFLVSFLTVVAAFAALGLAYELVVREFPNVGLLKTQFPVVTYRGKELPTEVHLQKTRPASWVSLEGVSKVAVGAIVVSEDWAFYQHHGYDPNQIREAIKEDLDQGGFARGASTITQQVVKNVFLTSDKNLWRKVKELVLAVRIEGVVSKKKILETYLNIAEWGEGIYGLTPAARYYFHKSPSELTAREGAFLAMLLPSPKRYSQSFRKRALTAYARGTITSILGKMTRARYIDESERERQVAARFWFELTPLSNDPSDVNLQENQAEPDPLPEPATENLNSSPAGNETPASEGPSDSAT